MICINILLDHMASFPNFNYVQKFLRTFTIRDESRAIASSAHNYVYLYIL